MTSNNDQSARTPQEPSPGGEPIVHSLLSELYQCADAALGGIDSATFDAAAELVNAAGRVFVLGVGHSGAIAKTLTMKLAHVGVRAFSVFAETIPPFGDDCVLIAVSQSGETTTVITLAEKARQLGGRVLAITGRVDSTLARLSSCILSMAPVPRGQNIRSLSVLGTVDQQNVRGAIFGLALYALSYSLIVTLAELRKETPISIDKRHANLE